ncbi:urate hydroxylase PuuD [Leptospira fletcheri]
MELALFTQQGLYFLVKYIHFLAGITWIGMLYYFNFVQGPFFNETDAETKKNATQKLVPRALWWFRWGAMFTFLSGIAMIALALSTGIPHNSQWVVVILVGAIFGTIMWANVWFVIWPNQKVVIAKAKGETTVDPAPNANRAFVASRTNTLLSIPMLFAMGAARNLPIAYSPNKLGMFLGLIGLIALIVEVNALVADQNGPSVKPIKSVKAVITSGSVFALVTYLLMEVLLTA